MPIHSASSNIAPHSASVEGGVDATSAHSSETTQTEAVEAPSDLAAGETAPMALSDPHAARLEAQMKRLDVSPKQKGELYRPDDSQMTDLNGEAKFPGLGGERIACRHLSLWVGMMRGKEYRSGKPVGGGSFVKTLQTQLGSEAAIAKNVPHETQRIFEVLLAHAPEKTLVDSDWSDFLKDQFSKMGKDDHREILVTTYHHAMLLTLRTKPDNVGRTKFVATFYDPNVTDNYFRAQARSIEQLCEQFKLDRMLEEPDFSHYGAELMLCCRLPDNPGELLKLDATANNACSSPPIKVMSNVRGALENKKYGSPALLLAAKAGAVGVFKGLIEAGADVNARIQDFTPLIVAADTGHADGIRLLIEAGANVNAKVGGWTPLMCAAYKGHADAIRLLLEAGANVNGRNGIGWTPLMLAANNGHADGVRFLLEAKANVNYRHQDGFTPLTIAADRGHADAIRLLLEAGANVNDRHRDGFTPLMLAARSGHLEVVKALCDAPGILPRARNKNGDTARLIARRAGHPQVVAALNRFYLAPPGKTGIGRLVSLGRFIRSRISKPHD